MKVSLREITKHDFKAVCDLSLPDEQYKYLSHNETSLLESHYHDTVTARAIYLEEEPVGFIMWAAESTSKVIIYRFMVTHKHQNKGIGRKALYLSFDEIKTDEQVEEIEICYSLDNISAKGLYASVGFVETGIDEDDEMLAVIKVSELTASIPDNMSKSSIISTESALDNHYGMANPRSLAKEADQLTPAYQQWIESAPFMAIASIGSGGLDCSPRGDEVGSLFRVLDDKTIAIPDRPGNNRLDTLRNLVNDPRVALLFLIPGIKETMRINGTAVVETNESLLDSFAVNGKKPVTVVVVTIQAVYFQCGRAVLRSKLWDPTQQIASESVPTAGQMIQSVESDFDGSTYDSELLNRQQRTLY